MTRIRGSLALLAVAVAATASAAPPKAPDAAVPKAPGVVPRALDAAPIPRAKTALPGPADWAKAEAVALARPLPSGCHAWLVREWLKIRCDTTTGSVAVLSGPREGVAFFIVNPSFSGTDKRTPSGEVILPLRPGDRRLVQLTNISGGGAYEGPAAQTLALLVSELWLEGDAAPIVTVGPVPKSEPVLGMRFGVDTNAQLGPRVAEVAPGSAGERAGFKVGDSLFEFFGSASSLTERVDDAPAGPLRVTKSKRANGQLATSAAKLHVGRP